MKLESEARAAGRCFEHLTRGMISGKLLEAGSISWLLRNPFASGYLHYVTVRRARLSVYSWQ